MSDEDISLHEDFHPSLQTVPVEVFLYICSFLDGKDIFKNLKLVCKSFYEILSDDGAWRTWLKLRWPQFSSTYLCNEENVISKPTLCIYIDRGLTLWAKEEFTGQKWSNECEHISTVDAVKLIQGGRIGLSGSRDRSLAVWNTCDQLTLIDKKEVAHMGWIWDITWCEDTNQIYSCSWDSHVKLWSLDQQLTQVASFKCKGACLSVACRPELVAVGQFVARVDVIDPLSGPITSYTCHNQPIMAVCLVRDFIVSASEDKTISVYDLKAGKVFKSGIEVSCAAFPMTLSFHSGNLLFVGDNESRLHILDTQHDKFQLVESFDLGHQPRGSITSMWHDPGFVLTSSKDATVRIHTTTRPPGLITQLSSSHGGITSIDFADPMLFGGCINNAVELWNPKSIKKDSEDS